MNKIAAFTLALVAGGASGQNLLNNAGFEDPLGFDFADVTNWNGFFGGPAGTFLQAFNDTGATPRSGNNALVLTIQGDASFPTTGFDAFTGHVQQIPGIAEGAEYDLSIWARASTTATSLTSASLSMTRPSFSFPHPPRPRCSAWVDSALCAAVDNASFTRPALSRGHARPCPFVCTHPVGK